MVTTNRPDGIQDIFGDLQTSVRTMQDALRRLEEFEKDLCGREAGVLVRICVEVTPLVKYLDGDYYLACELQGSEVTHSVLLQARAITLAGGRTEEVVGDGVIYGGKELLLTRSGFLKTLSYEGAASRGCGHWKAEVGRLMAPGAVAIWPLSEILEGFQRVLAAALAKLRTREQKLQERLDLVESHLKK